MGQTLIKLEISAGTFTYEIPLTVQWEVGKDIYTKSR